MSLLYNNKSIEIKQNELMTVKPHVKAFDEHDPKNSGSKIFLI